jgi:hypothetical protein
MAQSIQSLIAAAVNGTLRARYPDNYCSLCHVHAIVGANVISVVFNRVYRPVAGLAVIDCGGDYIRLTDNTAFSNPAGGAFHCWIESADGSPRDTEMIDLAARHYHEYAARNGIAWRGAPPPSYIWGSRHKVVPRYELDRLPPAFEKGQVWLRETDEGWSWITRHLADNMNAYVRLTALALQELQGLLPADSRLLEPLMPPRERNEGGQLVDCPA